jgi:hypothetical protein
MNATDKRLALRAAFAEQRKYRSIIRMDDGSEVFQKPGQYVAAAFRGTAGKPEFHYSFQNEAAMMARITEFTRSVEADMRYRAEERAKIQAMRDSIQVKPGDVFVHVWGYDQTNVDYYQVVEVKAQSVVIREIAQLVESSGLDMHGMCTPKVGAFVGEPLLKRLTYIADGVCIKMSHGTATPLKPIAVVDGVQIFEPKRWTNYA